MQLIIIQVRPSLQSRHAASQFFVSQATCASLLFFIEFCPTSQEPQQETALSRFIFLFATIPTARTSSACESTHGGRHSLFSLTEKTRTHHGVCSLGLPSLGGLPFNVPPTAPRNCSTLTACNKPRLITTQQIITTQESAHIFRGSSLVLQRNASGTANE